MNLKNLKTTLFKDIKLYFPLLVLIELTFLATFFSFFLTIYLKLVDILTEISVKSEQLVSNIDIDGMSYQEIGTILNEQNILVELLHKSYWTFATLVLGLVLIYLIFTLVSYSIILRKTNKTFNFSNFIGKYTGFNLIYLVVGIGLFYLFVRLNILISSLNITSLDTVLQIIFIVLYFFLFYLIFQGYRLLVDHNLIHTLKSQFFKPLKNLKEFMVNYILSILIFSLFLTVYLIIFYKGFFLTSLFFGVVFLIPVIVIVRINQITIKLSKKNKKKSVN